MPAATVIKGCRIFGQVINRAVENSQILIFNRVMILGSRPHIPTQFFWGNLTAPSRVLCCVFNFKVLTSFSDQKLGIRIWPRQNYLPRPNSARLPLMWPGFDSWTQHHINIWVEFVVSVVGCCPCCEGFSRHRVLQFYSLHKNQHF